MNKNIRIGIIGAGPAGLAAAEALKDKGYTQVTVLEKKNRVGGQSLSVLYKKPNNEEVVYELGSVAPVSGKILYRLMKKYNLHLGKDPFINKPLHVKHYSLEQRKVTLDFSKYRTGYPAKYFFPWFLDMWKLALYLFKYRQLAKPGFINITDKQNEELSIPTSQWIDERNFIFIGENLKLAMGLLLNAADPKFNNEIAAIICLKFMFQLLRFPPRYINGTVLQMREGYQELWKRVAKNHNVLLSKAIKSVTRGRDEIKVELVNNEILFFDKLIITCPSFEITKFLEVTEEEKQIFNKVLYCPTWHGAFLAKGLPHDALYSFPEPYSSREYPLRLQSFWPEGRIDDETWLYGFGFGGLDPNDLEKAKAVAESALYEHFNGQIVKWLNILNWQEFAPHFSCNEIHNGIYKQLESLQGKNDTFYSGGLFSGGTHPTVIDYSYNLIERFFK